MSKKLENLTPAQEEKLRGYAFKWLDKILKYQLLENWDDAKAIKYGELLYEMAGLEKPTVIIGDSPKDIHDKAVVLAKKEGITDSIPFSSYINASDYGWLAFCEFYIDEFPGEMEKDKEEKFWQLKDIMDSGVFMSIQREKFYFISKPPKYIERDNEFRLHSVKGPALEFIDGYKQYYIHGRQTEAKYVEGFTFNDFIKEKNADNQAAMISVIKERESSPVEGVKALMGFLNAEVVDEQEITHSSGRTEIVRLYKTKKSFPFLNDHLGKSGCPYAFTEMVCPSTDTTFLIETSSAFTSALESMKYHRPRRVEMDMAYDWQEFTN